MHAWGYQSKWTSGRATWNAKAIREKAGSIYDHLAEKEPSGPSPAPGLCSHGWFHRFKQRFSLHNFARTVTQKNEGHCRLAHTVGGEGFSDMTEEDVAELIDSMEQTLRGRDYPDE
ncbi:hypothetical protein GWK47_019468 [Chionoecetes opilio]|uniref:HTH CENPB-type domain-containing protein n=1 Tax=Chionoecetes opilio TaxID=41210 RepID=A0A8J4XQ84_CHIOP|nr:hypothetical protein GWK47_019468 [Chionoecetes opilio]